MLSSNHKNHNFSEFIKKRQCLELQMVILKVASHFVFWPGNVSDYERYVVFPFMWSICCPPIAIRIHALWKEKCGCFISIYIKEKSKPNKFLLIGPRSQHSLRMSLTHWLTHSLTTLLKIEWINPCWLGYSSRICKICKICRKCKIYRIGSISWIGRMSKACKICGMYAEYEDNVG